MEGVLGPAEVINLVTGAGGALAALVFFGYLWLAGKIHSQSEFKSVCEQRDEWKVLFQEEQRSHGRTRETLVVANERADVAVNTAKVANRLLEAAERRAITSGHRRPRNGDPK